MKIVWLTGGIGSGKSEVSKFFQAWGAYIFDADKEAKHIINTEESAQKEIIKELKLEFNKARQAAITTEMLEIVGGAEALVD